MHGDVSVRDVMTREYVGVSESDPVLETVELLVGEGTQTAVVLRGVDPIGLLTPADIFEVLANGLDPAETAVAERMTDDPPTVSPDQSVPEAADMLAAVGVESLLVLDNGDAAGILTARDLVAASQLSSEATPSYAEEPATPTASLDQDEPNGGGETGEAYSSQSICEACGSLTRDLADVNGQLLCIDCRDM